MLVVFDITVHHNLYMVMFLLIPDVIHFSQFVELK
jgi:hypothetical protein